MYFGALTIVRRRYHFHTSTLSLLHYWCYHYRNSALSSSHFGVSRMSLQFYHVLRRYHHLTLALWPLYVGVITIVLRCYHHRTSTLSPSHISIFKYFGVITIERRRYQYHTSVTNLITVARNLSVEKNIRLGRDQEEILLTIGHYLNHENITPKLSEISWTQVLNTDIYIGHCFCQKQNTMFSIQSMFYLLQMFISKNYAMHFCKTFNKEL